jgi:diaminopimelate decarboxylase
MHSHLRTGGSESKFGIPVTHIPRLKSVVEKYKLKITGLHHHIGTTSYTNAKILSQAMSLLFNVAYQFPDLKHLDFGGGFYVNYKPTDKPIDIKAMGSAAEKLGKQFFKKYGRTIELSFEPGRFPICEAGTLYVTVTDIKDNPGNKCFIGVDSGMGHLIRPALYDAYHQIENISRPRAKKVRATIAGNICESGDFFAKNRLIARPEIGDMLAIHNAGAYGYMMSSDYNLRPRPAEILVDGSTARIIRERTSVSE